MKWFDPDALYVALDRRRRRERLSWRDLARQAEVSPSPLTRLGQGKRPDADGIVRLLAWLGTTDLAPFVTDDPPAGVASPPNQDLTPEEFPWSP